jgi:hypothetical protein
VIVDCCNRCPFFQHTVLALIASKSGAGGVCSYDANHDRVVTVDTSLTPGTPEHVENRRAVWSRMKIEDPTQIPDACPLRRRNVTITLGD